jgi:hypothetical protein
MMVMIFRDANTTSVYAKCQLRSLAMIDYGIKTYLAVESDATEVDHDNEDEEYCDPDSRTDRIVPELDQGGCGTDLCWH